jgi:hypothetical protein
LHAAAAKHLSRVCGSSAWYGTVFVLSPANSQWNEKVIYAFQSGAFDGESPQSGVVLDTAGNLLGTTPLGYATGGGTTGNGIVYELVPGNGGQWREKVLYGFCALNYCADGATPNAPVLIDKADNVYGTTSSGGLSQTYGVVFALAPRT